jgi:hypothetical protein
VLIALRVYLAATTVSYLHYVMVHERVGTLRPVIPSRQLRQPQRHAPTTPLPLPKRRAKFMQVTALHPLPNYTCPYLAVLPHPPSCSTNPHGGIAAVFYLSSRRQSTSTPSCFSLSNHVSSSSGTPTYASLLH